MSAIVDKIITSAHLGLMADALVEMIGYHNMISFYHIVTLSVKPIDYVTLMSQLIAKVCTLV